MKHKFARQYESLEQWHWWFRGRRAIIESVLNHEIARSGSRHILSVGCGPVAGLRWITPFTGAAGRVFGLDVDPIHAPHDPDQIVFVVGKLENAPFEDSSFDMVLGLDILEHLEDDLAGLREAIRLTKPGGLILVTVPALPSLWGKQDIVSEHRRRYTRHSLSRLLKKAGIQDYKISYYNTFLFPFTASVRWCRRALGLESHAQSDFDYNHPGIINDLLTGVFSAERHLINYVPLPIGVSLLARCRTPVKHST